MKKLALEPTQLIPSDGSRRDSNAADLVWDLIHDGISIKDHPEFKGLAFPIIVAPYEDTNTYIIFDGNNRAIGYGGQDTPVEAIVLCNDGDLTELLQMLEREGKSEMWPHHDCQSFNELYRGAVFTFERNFGEDYGTLDRLIKFEGYEPSPKPPSL